MRKLIFLFVLAVLFTAYAVPNALCLGAGGDGHTIYIKIGDTAREDFPLINDGDAPVQVTYEVTECPSFAKVVKVTTNKGDFPITLQPGEKVVCSLYVHADTSGQGDLRIRFIGKAVDGNLGTFVGCLWKLVASPDVETTNKQLTPEDIGVSKPAAPPAIPYVLVTVDDDCLECPDANFTSLGEALSALSSFNECYVRVFPGCYCEGVFEVSGFHAVYLEFMEGARFVNTSFHFVNCCYVAVLSWGVLEGNSSLDAGVLVEDCRDVWLKGLTIQGFSTGVVVVNSSKVTLLDCRIVDNGVGVKVDNATTGFTAFLNIFNNTVDAICNSTDSTWHHPGIYPFIVDVGNYWSSYTGEDSDEDGIGDTPYTIPGTANKQDPYPLTGRPIVLSTYPRNCSSIYWISPLFCLRCWSFPELNCSKVQLLFDGVDVAEDTVVLPVYVGYYFDDDHLAAGTHNFTLYLENLAGESAQYRFQVAVDADIVKHNLTLKDGWNLVSIPVYNPRAHSRDYQYCWPLSWLFGENSSVKAYRWDPSTASYQEVQFFLKVGEGYWLYTPRPISTTFYAKVVDSLTLELKPGWNLIGSIYYNAKVKCLEGEVYSGAFTWTGSDYCEVKALKPGRGYWILAYRPSVVQLVPR